MEAESTYKSLDNWVENLPRVQYALLLWTSAFIATLLAGIIIPGTTLMTAAMTAIGGATGVTFIMSLMRSPET